MIKVGIVGGTGYTGVELLRLLAQHPQAEVAVITSRSEAGVAVADMYPNLRGHYDGLVSACRTARRWAPVMWCSSPPRTALPTPWPASCWRRAPR
jgi:N-acetyl-gamma-glutamylphosphate reductase